MFEPLFEMKLTKFNIVGSISNLIIPLNISHINVLRDWVESTIGEQLQLYIFLTLLSMRNE